MESGLLPIGGVPQRDKAAAHGQQMMSDERRLREASVQLEAVFLSELLKASGLDNRAQGFGGGIGEAQTASYLRDLQARQIAESGGVGLAEMIFISLSARHDAP